MISMMHAKHLLRYKSLLPPTSRYLRYFCTNNKKDEEVSKDEFREHLAKKRELGRAKAPKHWQTEMYNEGVLQDSETGKSYTGFRGTRLIGVRLY